MFKAGDNVSVYSAIWALMNKANHREAAVIRETTWPLLVNTNLHSNYRSYDVLLWPTTQQAQIIKALGWQLKKVGENYDVNNLRKLMQLPTAHTITAEVFNKAVGWIQNGRKI